MAAPDIGDAGIADPIRILLVDDHLLISDAIAAMLSYEDGLEVVSVASSGTDAVRLADELRPHVVIMDVTLKGLNGIEATREITRQHADIGVLVVTMHDDAETVTAAIAAGARGFLPKNIDSATLVEAIRSVVRGESYLDPAAARLFLDRVRPLAAEIADGGRLTSQEQRTLKLLADGNSTKQIARELTISEDTVKTHLRHIYQKLGAADRTQAVAFAIRTGLIP